MKIGDIYRETKYLVFTVTAKKPKTIQMTVTNKKGHILGTIRWHGNWRQYVYETFEDEIIYNHQCLKDIAGVLDSLNDLHRKGYDV